MKSNSFIASGLLEDLSINYFNNEQNLIRSLGRKRMNLQEYMKNAVEKNEYDLTLERKIDQISLELKDYKTDVSALKEDISVIKIHMDKQNQEMAKFTPILEMFNLRIMADKELRRRAKNLLFWLSIVGALSVVYAFGKTFLRDLINIVK